MENRIESLINQIYQGNMTGIETKIIDLLTDIMNLESINQNLFLEIVKIINIEMSNKNYTYIVDVLQNDLLKII